MVFNDFPLIDDLVFGNGGNLSGWLLDLPFVTPDGDDILSDLNQAFFGSILYSIIAKDAQGVYVGVIFLLCSSLTLLQ